MLNHLNKAIDFQIYISLHLKIYPNLIHNFKLIFNNHFYHLKNK